MRAFDHVGTPVRMSLSASDERGVAKALFAATLSTAREKDSGKGLYVRPRRTTLPHWRVTWEKASRSLLRGTLREDRWSLYRRGPDREGVGFLSRGVRVAGDPNDSNDSNDSNCGRIEPKAAGLPASLLVALVAAALFQASSLVRPTGRIVDAATNQPLAGRWRFRSSGRHRRPARPRYWQ